MVWYHIGKIMEKKAGWFIVEYMNFNEMNSFDAGSIQGLLLMGGRISLKKAYIDIAGFRPLNSDLTGLLFLPYLKVGVFF